MKISIIGTGYVGLVAGACFADTGHSVICVDRNDEKIANLKKGIIPIYEPGLTDIVKRTYENGRLKFTTSTKEAVEASSVIFFAIDTPPTPSGECDLTNFQSAVLEVARAMPDYRILVNKSTVPVGTYQKVKEWVSQTTKQNFDVVSNPEFLKEGTAVDDFTKPDRVVIGCESDSVFEKMSEIYAPFVRRGNAIIKMDPVSAEMSKYACNSYLATRISFMNEMAELSEKMGSDIEAIRKVMASDPRIGPQFLYAGLGYGGSCLPKDVKAIVRTAKSNEIHLDIVNAAEEANQRQRLRMSRRIAESFSNDLAGKKVAFWGLSFKPNTDDMREAPSVAIISNLLDGGATVIAYDPVAMDEARKVLGDRIGYAKDMYEAAKDADAIVIATEWNEFRNPDFETLKKQMKGKKVFDGRNILSRKQVRESGFDHYGIGWKN